MNSFLPLLIGAMKSDVATTVKRTKRQVILYSALCLFALTTYVLAIVAAIFYAATYLGTFEAILVAAAISAATSLLVIAILAAMNYRDKKARRHGAYKTLAVAQMGASSVSSVTDGMNLKKLLMVAAASFAATKLSQTRK